MHLFTFYIDVFTTGASIIRMMANIIGEKTFKEGLTNYLKSRWERLLSLRRQLFVRLIHLIFYFRISKFR